MIAHKAAAPPIGRDGRGARQRRRAQRHHPRRHGASEDAVGSRRCALALYALVRLGSYDALAGAVLDADGRPRSRWWPIAYAFQRVNDPRAAPALLDLLQRRGTADARVCRARPWRSRRIRAPPRRCWPSPRTPASRLAVRIQAVRGLALIGDADGGAAMRRLIVVAEGRSEPAARGDHRAGAAAQPRRRSSC